MIALSARAARSSKASLSSRERCSRWAPSSARRQRSSIARPARSSPGGSRPIRLSCRVRCRAAHCPTAAPARAFIARSSSSRSTRRPAPRLRSTTSCANERHPCFSRRAQLGGRSGGACRRADPPAERFIATRGPDFQGSISLLITGDEEGVAVNGTKKVLEWLKARGETLDACVVGEPTSATELGDMIKIGRRGSMTGRLTVSGVQGHVAYPHLADNAAHRIIALLHALTAMPLDPGTEHFQRSGLQVTTIDIGNTTTNIIPGAARATFNIRFNDLWTSDKLKEWVAKRLAMAGGNYHLEWAVSGEAFLVPPGKVSDCLTQAIAAVTGRAPELSTTGGTSDARFIQAYCPVAEFGLVGETMHKADERVPIADITQLVAIYEAFLDRFFAIA